MNVFAPSSRARLENSGRKFSAVARREPTGLDVCRIGDRGGNAAARSGFLLAALHSGAKTFIHRPTYHRATVCPRLLGNEECPLYPRPMNGILGGRMVMNWMFAFSGSLAMCSTASATCLT